MVEGVLRELREETGWDGRVLTLLRINSRPDRPHEDRQNVAFDFVIEPLEKRGEPDAESSDVQSARTSIFVDGWYRRRSSFESGETPSRLQHALYRCGVSGARRMGQTARRRIR
jgi:8-oxo-dGTP pyrophosphatase MutT (NUDIX family)